MDNPCRSKRTSFDKGVWFHHVASISIRELIGDTIDSSKGSNNSQVVSKPEFLPILGGAPSASPCSIIARSKFIYVSLDIIRLGLCLGFKQDLQEFDAMSLVEGQLDVRLTKVMDCAFGLVFRLGCAIAKNVDKALLR